MPNVEPCAAEDSRHLCSNSYFAAKIVEKRKTHLKKHCSTIASVSVCVRLVWASNLHANVVRLVFGQFSHLCAESRQVQSRNLLIKVGRLPQNTILPERNTQHQESRAESIHLLLNHCSICWPLNMDPEPIESRWQYFDLKTRHADCTIYSPINAQTSDFSRRIQRTYTHHFKPSLVSVRACENIKILWKQIHFVLVALALFPILENVQLREDLVGERARHDKGWVTSCATKIA